MGGICTHVDEKQLQMTEVNYVTLLYYTYLQHFYNCNGSFYFWRHSKHFEFVWICSKIAYTKHLKKLNITIIEIIKYRKLYSLGI